MAEIELIKGADNGNPPDRLNEAYPKVNRNFQGLSERVNDVKSTMDQLIVQGDSGPEAAAARYSSVFNKSFVTLKDRLDYAENILEEERSGRIEYVYPSKYENLQSAIDDCAAAGGGTVFIMPGDYTETGILLKPKVCLAGSGDASCFYADSSGPVFSLENSALTNVNVKISNIKIRARVANVTGFKFKKSSIVSIESMHFEGVAINYHFDGGEHIRIRDTYVSGAVENLLVAGKSIFESTDKAGYIAGIDAVGYTVHNVGNGVNGPVMTFNRAVSAFVSHLHTNDLAAGAIPGDGILFTGDCQGCKVSNSLIVRPENYGIKTDSELINGAESAGGAIEFANVDIDQAVNFAMFFRRSVWIGVHGGILTASGSHAVVIESSNVSVNGSKIIQASGQGIQLGVNVNHVTVTGCHIEHTGAAILAPSGSAGDYYIFTNNDLSIGNSFGILDETTGTHKVKANNLT